MSAGTMTRRGDGRDVSTCARRPAGCVTASRLVGPLRGAAVGPVLVLGPGAPAGGEEAASGTVAARRIGLSWRRCVAGAGSSSPSPSPFLSFSRRSENTTPSEDTPGSLKATDTLASLCGTSALSGTLSATLSGLGKLGSPKLTGTLSGGRSSAIEAAGIVASEEAGAPTETGILFADDMGGALVKTSSPSRLNGDRRTAVGSSSWRRRVVMGGGTATAGSRMVLGSNSNVFSSDMRAQRRASRIAVTSSQRSALS